MTDYRALCAELLAALENAIRVVYCEDGTQHISTADPVIAKADAALAEQQEEGPSDEEWDALVARAIRQELARWGRPAPVPVVVPVPVEARAALAEPVGEGPAAWLYKGDPDFDGTTWGAKWCVTTDEHLARFKTRPDEPIPLFRRTTTPPAPEVGELGELVLSLRETAAKLDDDWYHASARIMRSAAALLQQQAAPAPAVVPVAIPGEQWHEDDGACLWWRFEIDEPPWVGDPRDSDWPGYHTHFTRIVCPLPQAGEGEGEA